MNRFECINMRKIRKKYKFHMVFALRFSRVTFLIYKCTYKNCNFKALVRRAILASNIAIKRYSDIAIKRYFSSCELKISIYGYRRWFRKVTAIFWQKNIAFVTKIISLSLYRFIAISLYRNIARQNRSSDEGLSLI